MNKPVYLIIKRLFDFTFSLFGILILWPLFIIIAIAIKLDSKGPVFYRGVRIGQFWKPIRPYKFRTMVHHAEKQGGTLTALNDPRITKVGSFLRTHKLDELPQLFNVLAGTMSLVGPRPEVKEHIEKYTEDEKIILSVKSGITDYASIRFKNLGNAVGKNNAQKVFIKKIRPEKNKLRVAYVKNRSFIGDINILLKTIIALLHHDKKTY